MALFWLVYRIDDDLTISIQEARSLITAQLKASFAGLGGDLAEGYQLDIKTTKKVPKSMLGRALTRKEAENILTELS